MKKKHVSIYALALMLLSGGNTFASMDIKVQVIIQQYQEKWRKRLFPITP